MSASAAFRANATSRAQLPDEDWLTGSDLNILENEAHAPGRRGGWSRGEAWKNIRIANRGTYSTELMRKWNAVKQKSSHRAVKSKRYISKTDGRFHLFGFVYDCSHIKSNRKGQKTQLNGGLKLFGGPKIILESCIWCFSVCGP